MPEGDSIHKAAARLRPVLLGQTLVRFEAARAHVPLPRPGVTITEVEAHGKHLIVRFDDAHVLRTHLGMTGRWDLYRREERWRRPAHLARAVIVVPDHVAVCSSAPTVEITRQPPGSDSLRSLEHLGPDLCRPEADLVAAAARMAAIPDPGSAIADVLLDQRVAAGVGNVFKSEVLWACRLHPLTPLSDVDESMRRRLLMTAAQQLRANLSTARRTTVAGRPGSLAVYQRGRRPCLRCGTPIAWRRTGPQNRSTYWCPRCQPASP
jgi:endonuclease-8